jgi:hypothetical protein
VACEILWIYSVFYNDTYNRHGAHTEKIETAVRVSKSLRVFLPRQHCIIHIRYFAVILWISDVELYELLWNILYIYEHKIQKLLCVKTLKVANMRIQTIMLSFHRVHEVNAYEDDRLRPSPYFLFVNTERIFKIRNLEVICGRNRYQKMITKLHNF